MPWSATRIRTRGLAQLRQRLPCATQYEPLYPQFDLWVMLAAPSFEQVTAGVREQEEKLRAATAGGAAGLMDLQTSSLSALSRTSSATRASACASSRTRVDVLCSLDAQAPHRRLRADSMP
jgi:hypothetical protein